MMTFPALMGFFFSVVFRNHCSLFGHHIISADAIVGSYRSQQEVNRSQQESIFRLAIAVDGEINMADVIVAWLLMTVNRKKERLPVLIFRLHTSKALWDL